MAGEVLPPPPRPEAIGELEALLGTTFPEEMRLFFLTFRCEKIDHEWYLQYNPHLVHATEYARGNDGWLPGNVVRLPASDEVVFYEDPGGDYSTYQIRKPGAPYKVFDRCHDGEDDEYGLFSDWLERHLEVLVTVLEQEEAEEARPKRWWQFWRRQ
jgi:hypothetical protein